MIRVGLVGLGAAADSIWVPALKKLRGVELVAGADPDASAVGRMARLAPGVAVHQDLGQLLEDHRSVDWIIVATPPETHAELCIQALDAGRHVLCEKPFAPTLAEVAQILEAAERAGRVIAVNHEMTNMPMVAKSLKKISSGAHGPLLFAQAWQTLVDPPGGGWRTNGLTMVEFGTHTVDLMIHAFGEVPSAVLAAMPRPDGMQGDPVDLVTMFFSGGRAGHLVLDRVCRGQHQYLELRFDCATASIRASMGGRASVEVGLDARSRRPQLRLDLAAGGQAWVEKNSDRSVIARNPPDTLAHATQAHVGQVFASVARGAEPPGSGRRARDVVRVVEAAYRSAAEGRRISLSEIY